MGKLIIKNLFDTVNTSDILTAERKPIYNFSKKHKSNYKMTIGTRLGRDGRMAFIYQIVDRAKNYYKKFVKVGNEVIKNIEGKLTNHKGC